MKNKKLYHIVMLMLILLLLTQLSTYFYVPTIRRSGLQSLPWADEVSFNQKNQKLVSVEDLLFTSDIEIEIYNYKFDSISELMTTKLGSVHQANWYHQRYLALITYTQNLIKVFDTTTKQSLGSFNITDGQFTNGYVDETGILYYQKTNEIIRYDLHENQEIDRKIIPFPEYKFQSQNTISEWGPNGDYLYVKLFNSSSWLINSNDVSDITKLGSNIDEIQWSDDGARLLLITQKSFSTDGTLEIFDIKQGRIATAPDYIAQHESRTMRSSYFDFSHTNEQIMRVIGQQILIWNIDTNEITTINLSSDYNVEPEIYSGELVWDSKNDQLFSHSGNIYRLDLSQSNRNLMTIKQVTSIYMMFPGLYIMITFIAIITVFIKNKLWSDKSRTEDQQNNENLYIPTEVT